MADPVIPATPQQFSFGGRLLYGIVTAYEGSDDIRSASHKALKRDGGIEEEMGRDQRKLQVNLVFIGADCAKQYQDTAAFMDGHRTALLVHPIAGKYTALCKGLNHRIDFSTAINRIDAPCTFIESELDATIPADTPPVTAAAQNATDQKSQFQQSVAAFLGKIAKAQTTSTAAFNSLDKALAQATSVVTAPVDYMAAQVNLALGAASSIVAVVANVKAASDNLTQSVASFLAVTGDLFDGASDTSTAATPDQVATLIGIVQANASTLEDALFAATNTPAGCAAAVADVEIMVDACMTLTDALAAQLPPTMVYINPVTQGLLVLAQKLIDDMELSYDALTYASAILGYNRIPNPAAVPAGASLTVPTA